MCREKRFGHKYDKKKSYLLDSGRGGRVARQNRKLITEIKVWKWQIADFYIWIEIKFKWVNSPQMKDWGDDGVSAGWGYRSPNPPHRAQEEEEEEEEEN